MASYARVLRQKYPYRAPSASVDHVVVGGGVVGLAVAAGLVNTAGPGRTTFVVERRQLLGQENTARNSEVIHSGIYYPVGSLKSQLCIRGRDLLYERAAALGIPHRKTGKLIVATDKHQIPYLDGLQDHSVHPAFLTGRNESAMDNNSVIPAYFLSGDEARDMEPDLSPDVCAALLVTETGIVDSGALVASLEREIQEDDYLGDNRKVGVGLAGRSFERGEGVIVPGTRVVRIDAEGGGWVVQLESNWEGEPTLDAVKADVVVDAAGLNSAALVNELLPEDERMRIYVSKGNYMSYKGPGANVSKLIYPCPSVSLDSLGTHLVSRAATVLTQTFDLDGNIRFGPDVEDLGEDPADPDFWQKHLAPSSAHLESIGAAARAMLPGVDPGLLQPDYAGFRPNIAPPGAGFFDFMVRHSPQRRGLVEMFGFASPGLTSSLAAGEYVAKMVRAQVWGGRDAERLADGWDM